MDENKMKINFEPVDLNNVTVVEDEEMEIKFTPVDGSVGVMFINTDDETKELKGLVGTLFGVKLRAKMGTIVKKDGTKLTVLKFFLEKKRDGGMGIIVNKQDTKATKDTGEDNPF